jgi:hypothetical protein
MILEVANLSTSARARAWISSGPLPRRRPSSRGIRRQRIGSESTDARTRRQQREYHNDPRSGDPQHPPGEGADFERAFVEAQVIIAGDTVSTNRQRINGWALRKAQP